MAISRMEVLKLYKTLLKESGKFANYNFRMYALRRIKSRFRENKSITDPVEVEFYYKEGQRNLELIKRQVIVNELYKPEKLVIEKKSEDV